MIKNVVFDVGDVLIDFRYVEYMRDLGFDEETISLLTEKMIMSEHWRELDLGIAKESDAPDYYASILPKYREQINIFWKHIDKIVKEYAEAAPLISKLKEQGLRVYLLSNYPPNLSDLHWKVFTFMDKLDGMIISGKEGIAKPDTRIYRLLASRYGIELSESVFIDDRQINIDAAKGVGMKAILFTGYDNLYDELSKSLGVNGKKLINF